MQLRSAFLYMITGRALSLAVMALGFAMLARLLPPAAFGHFAIALAIFGMAEVISQFGLRQLLISRREDHSADEIAAAAGLSLVISVALCLTGLAAVVFLPNSILPPPLAETLLPLSLALLVGPFTLSTEALLQRSLLFGLVSISTLVRVIVDVAVAVWLAVAGFGAAALGWGFLASHCAAAVFLVIGGGAERRIFPRFGAWRGLLGWGNRMTLLQILPKASDMTMIAALSAAQGAALVGLFNRALTIHRLLDRTLLEGIKPVVLPAFSGALRDGVDPARLYRVKLDYMAAICWPGFALIGLLAGPLVAVLLGRGWEHAVPVVQILALMGLSLPVTKMSQKLFVALGEIGAYLRIEAIREAVRVPLAVAGALISLEAFALAYVVGSFVKATGVMGYARSRFGGPEGGYLPVARQAGPLVLAALAGPVAVLAADLSAVATLALALPLAGLGWACAAGLLRHPVFVVMRALAVRARQALPF